METADFLIVFFIVMLGALVQGSTSMGFAITAAPILMIINPGFVPVPTLMSGFTLSIYLMIRERKSIIFKGLGFSIFGRILGAILATYIIVLISQTYFSLVFGGLILMAVLLSLIKGNWEINQPKLFFAGFLSGIMGTLASIGSPPMGLLYQHQKAKVIRGTLSAYFTLGTLISILSLSFVGKLTIVEFKLYLWMFPAFTLGFWLSRYVTKYLDRGYTRWAILAISSLSALFVIGKTLISII
jgi:uncharacterized membrane protein YfcA